MKEIMFVVAVRWFRLDNNRELWALSTTFISYILWHCENCLFGQQVQQNIENILIQHKNLAKMHILWGALKLFNIPSWSCYKMISQRLRSKTKFEIQFVSNILFYCKKPGEICMQIPQEKKILFYMQKRGRNSKNNKKFCLTLCFFREIGKWEGAMAVP